MRIEQVQIGPQRIRYGVRAGDSSRVPLLVLNGLGANIELARPFIDALNAPPIIIFDVPGVGGSPTPRSPYRPAGIARIAEGLLDHVGISGVDVLGVSWGGAIAQQFALRNPVRCRKLVLAATSPGALMVPGRPSVLFRMATPRRYVDPAHARRVAGHIYGGDFRRDRALVARTLRHVPERVIALKDAQIRAGAIVDRHIDSSAPTTRTVNGLVDPVLRVRTNQTQLLRLANISADIWYRLRVDGARLSVLAEDANPVGRVWTADELLLPPGKRYDVLARWPSAGTFSLRTLRFSSGPAGDTYPDRRLATVRVAGAPFAEESWPRAMGPMPHLQRKHVSRVRRLTFSEDAATGRFFINGRQFDASRVDEVAQLGTTEEWIVRNVTGEEHPFHIHTNDFQVLSINGKPYEARGLQDTVPLPVHGEVRLRMRFADFLGPSVYHCHILAHEDGGMMGVLDVTRSGRRPSARTLRGLRAMRMAMTMPASHHH